MNTIRQIRRLLPIGALAMCAGVHAQAVSTSTTRQGQAGDTVASQRGTLNLYTTKSGTSFGVSSTTTVTGGVAVDGHGNFIPNGTRGSSSQTTYGPTVTIPLPQGKR